MELRNLIETHLDLPRLSKYLDELGHPGRLWAVRQWSRANMMTLWEPAKGFRPVSLDDFVPADVAPGAQVIHHGKNSLPTFTHFQKRFSKPVGAAAKDTLVGYNEQANAIFTGPGYYVAHPSADAGEVDIDYTRVPAERAEGWPAIVPNSQRLGRFVYAGMVDVMRGLSSHVTIGRARKASGWMDAWFVLVREDPQPDPPAAS